MENLKFLSRKKVWFMNISDKGKKVVSPCIAVEGEPGYCGTDIEWKLSEKFTWEDAKSLCKERNIQMGHTKEICDYIIEESLRLQIKSRNLGEL